MTGNDKRRSIMLINFWSFDFIDLKGLPLQFGKKTFTGLEIVDLEIWTSQEILFFDRDLGSGLRNYFF